MDTYRPERLALTGATGALGLAFLQRNFLRDPKLCANLLVRRSSTSFQAEEFQHWLKKNADRVTLIDGDLRQIGDEQLAALFQTDGGLWHFAAMTSLTADSEAVSEEIRRVNVEGTHQLVEAALHRHAGSPFYHISTAYVVGKREGIALESESQMGQTFRNPYEASKLQAEMGARRAFASGVTGAIFRPSVVVDDKRGTSGFKMVDACAYAVALAVKRGEPFIFRTPLTARLNLVHSDWVIAALTDLARMPSGPGRTYHLTAPRSTYFRDIAAILEKLVPGLKVGFEPGLKRSELPTASKIFDKAITEIRPYFEAELEFDRTQTDRDISPAVKEAPMDLAPFVESRLRSELTRISHKT
jgi:nucleoside-diphosphate-sugar epimerase